MKSLLVAFVFLWSTCVQAEVENYTIDTKGAHAAIQFRIKHLGYSWLNGRFDDFSGTFKLDREEPAKSSVEVIINTDSVNSNHAERDKHLRGQDFLDVRKFPQATFRSTRIKLTSEKSGIIYGDLTLHGVTKEVEINAELVGGGKDPWGGFRVGFTGRTKIGLADFGIHYNLGPQSKEVEMILDVEGVKM